MKFYGIKINEMYLEKLNFKEGSNEVAVNCTAEMADAYTSKSKEDTLALATILIDELPGLEIKMLVFKVKVKEHAIKKGV